jgi:hypothetical protein
MHVDSPNHCTDRRFTEKYRKDSKHDSLSVSNYSKKTLSLSLSPSLPPSLPCMEKKAPIIKELGYHLRFFCS